ncbi:MAG TPA: Zn-dependent hydrolase [Thermomicrobiales bacterium]|jgi:allantoate deiminase
MMATLTIDPALVERYIAALARYGACGETGVCRAAYTPAWVAAQQQVAEWYAEAGLTVWRDAVGNQWGRLEGTDDGPVIATGSHIDSQLPGGRYDGALGIIGGIIALRTLKERYGPPRRSIDVVSFCQEESSRLPSANLLASRAIIGTLAPEEVDTLHSYDGETFREVLASVGLDADRIGEAVRDDIETFLELHIEQGPILEHERIAVGVVEAITGSRTYTVTITGRADHGGACPMDLRRDPMVAAAAIISEVLATASAMGRPAVTTVGRLLIEPNYPAIVPERVVVTVNARHPELAGGRELFARHEATFAAVAAANPQLGLGWTGTEGGEPTICDPGTVRLLAAVARDQGIAAKIMPSGAIHDCQIMAQRYKAAMLFVPSKDGRSHTPDEYTAPEELAAGIQVLAAALYRLAY